METEDDVVEYEVFPFLIWLTKQGYTEFESVAGAVLKLDTEADGDDIAEVDTNGPDDYPEWWVSVVNAAGEMVFSYDRYFSTGSMSIDEDLDALTLKESSCQDIPLDLSITLVGKPGKPSLISLYEAWKSIQKPHNDE